jgi:NAD-dependent deacetylase
MNSENSGGALLDDNLERAAQWLASSRKTVVSTGSGISKESGIPTFRDADGLWQNYRPEEIATREGFLSNPGLVWKWYRERLLQARDREPNPGHFALADLESLLPSLLIITQNIDNLHQRAGSREVVELHGNIERYRCLEHSHMFEFDPSWGDEPPLCHCGSLIRPDVVWFGEPLPAAELECAFRESGRCDVFLVIGTSGLVQPAAMLPAVAKQAGAKLIEVNVDTSAITRIVDIFLMGTSGTILPRLAARVRELLGRRDRSARRPPTGR